jgi:hypothetical protein
MITSAVHRRNPAHTLRLASMIASIGALAATGACGLDYTFTSNLQSWSGKDFSRVTQVYGAPHKIRKQPDHTTEYEYTLQEGKCVAVWVVDDNDKVLAWNHSGVCTNTF